MQLVLSNNRVIAHGENFLSMGGVVINTETGKRYENATVAECEGCPSDIDSVGYEYHAGEFVPCAPFGVGKGNVAVLCDDDCKVIKDSGIPMESFAASEYTSYTATSGDVSLTFNIKPDVLFITTDTAAQREYLGIILGDSMLCLGDADTPVEYIGKVDTDGYTVSWGFSGKSSNNQFKASGVTYDVYAFSVKGA